MVVYGPSPIFGRQRQVGVKHIDVKTRLPCAGLQQVGAKRRFVPTSERGHDDQGAARVREPALDYFRNHVKPSVRRLSASMPPAPDFILATASLSDDSCAGDSIRPSLRRTVTRIVKELLAKRRVAIQAIFELAEIAAEGLRRGVRTADAKYMLVSRQNDVKLNPAMSTPATNRDRPLRLDDADGCAWLRDAFVRAGYQSANLLRLFGLSNRNPCRSWTRPCVLGRLRDSGPLATLARLFQLRESVPDEAARVALAPLEPARVQAMGLLEVADGEVTAPFTIAPFDELLLVSDWMPFDRSSMPADCVTGLNPTTVLLAHITIRRPVGTALDMCTGNGAHALLAARHAGHVVATDVDPRALNMTAFNALLNAVDGIECRQGSLYNPVDGENIDVIVANPPFVISPEGPLPLPGRQSAG